MAAEIGIKVGLDASGLKKGADLATGSIAELRQVVKGLKSDLANTGADNPKGLQSLKAELQSSTQELKTLEKQAGISGAATGNALQKGFSGLRTLANILPGIGIAGIIGVVATTIGTLASEIFNYATAAKFAADKQNDLNIAVGDAQAKTAGELANVSSLVAIAGNEALSRDARTEALKKLNHEYPGYFTNANLDLVTADKLKASYDSLTGALLLNAKAKAIQSEIEKSAQRVSEAQNDENADLLSSLDKLKIGIASTFGGAGAASIKGAALATGKYNDLVGKETDLQKKLAKELLATNTQLANQGTLFDDSKAKKAPAPDKNTALADINKQIQAFEQLIQQGVATKADVQELFTLKIQKLDIQFPDSGFSTEQNEALKNKLEVDAQKAFASSPFTVKIQTTKFILPEQQSAFPLEFPTPTIVIDTAKALKSATLAGKGAALTLKDGLMKGVGQVDIAGALDQALSDAVIPAITNIGESIGNALLGGGFSQVIKSLGTSLGQFIIDFGKILIAGAIKIDALKKAASALFKSPATAIIVGIAAIAIGTAIKNAAAGNAKQRGFREGGISDGPSSGYYALLHGKEVIAPYDQAAKLLGGGDGGNMQLSGVLRADGRDLVAIIKTATKTNNRLGG